jgi:tRNA pseudouridine38-40 synthase
MRTVKIALDITYDGTLFDGWQDNKSNLSIEGMLKKAFFMLFKKEFLLDAASRTDKGVHALKQIVITYFDIERMSVFKLLKALNSKLPASIRVNHIVEVPDEFHPSLNAKKKTYLYKINLNSVSLPFFINTHWHLPVSLNIDMMKKASQFLLGTKDFSGFSNTTKKDSVNPICCLYDISFTETKDGFLHIEIIGDRFLYKMCRIIVGTLIEVGKGKLSLKDVEDLFTYKQRVNAGITAPACGLYLKNLNYPEFAILN